MLCVENGIVVYFLKTSLRGALTKVEDPTHVLYHPSGRTGMGSVQDPTLAYKTDTIILHGSNTGAVTPCPKGKTAVFTLP
jgi:hypothetical protein